MDWDQFVENEDVPLEMRLSQLRSASFFDLRFVELGEKLIKRVSKEDRIRLKQQVEDMERYVEHRRKRIKVSGKNGN